MGLFGRKKQSQQEMIASAMELRADALTSGGTFGGLGLGGMKAALELAEAAREQSVPLRAYALKMQRLSLTGSPGRATIISVEPTTIAPMLGGEQVRIQWTVTPTGGGAAYDASSDLVLPQGFGATLTPGSEVDVRIDPADPQSVMLAAPGVGLSAGAGMIMVSGSPVPYQPAPVQDAPTPEPAADGLDTRLANLEKLAKLHEAGDLTDAEFAAMKQKLLS